MKFIKLTDAETKKQRAIYVNMQHVLMLVPHPDNNTLLFLDTKLGPYPAYQSVTESVEMIQELIEEAW